MPYFNPATAESEEALYLGVAADVVQQLAPAPDPVPADYPARAARAERLLLGWLRATRGGVLTSKSVSGVASKAYAKNPEVRALVASAMGPHYAGAAGKGYVETWR